MSRLSHKKELQVVVCPDHVAVLQMRRQLTWRGLRLAVKDAYSVACDGDSLAPPWGAALQAVERALPGYANGKTVATVILSNHFLRYAMIPWSAELTDAEEELAFSRHCFTRIYGESAKKWALRLSPPCGHAPRLASAVDVELLDMLKGIFDRSGITLQSIQPHLMAAFNAFRHHLGKRSAWIALLEPGYLCLALVQQGSWQRVRGLRIGGAWHAELPLILERESYMADLGEVPHEVYLWNAGGGETTLPEHAAWTFHSLNPRAEPGAAKVSGQRSASAMTG